MIWAAPDRTSSVPLYRQIYASIQHGIQQGAIRTGERLPSSRELAASLHVSRNIVIHAYELLHAEGYIEGKHGSGTFVTDGVYLESSAPFGNRQGDSFGGQTEQDRSHSSSPNTQDIVHFRPGTPALDQFPRGRWGQLLRSVCLEAPESALGYDQPEGRSELRTALMHDLHATRGVRCTPNQIIITSGATQALSLIAKLLLVPGTEAIVEDPVTEEIHRMFDMPGTTMHAVPVDDQGIRTDMLPRSYSPAFVYTTPSHQFPLGGVLPIQRRIQLIQYARATGCYLIEDDYDSEYRYDSPPVSSMQGLAPEHVIYVGTFSKVLTPALRIGYLILPPHLIKQYRDLKWMNDLHTPSIEQLALARFMEEGHLERHIAKLRKIYRKRRNVLMHLLADTFRDHSIRLLGCSTGLHLVAELPGIRFTPQLLSHLERNGVKADVVERHAISKGKQLHRIILGYGNLSEREIRSGVERLFRAIHSYSAHN
ncbi:PLP-dependent aminotransferase family protein [Paenibacillus sp. J5C_2022]|uniref:MocR-like pyridoxine biosynthesis transcription factor PdxR n=1 Tax=Paenibacillus sp. J5C2022 TaxID=2977129 RepID=UPI0021D1519E|nr:PLP-dependent aminotransferase family protein [Paenibacillus sp. J5C2022]MCU6710573.1 PLP-dependent aminotransferase family protein [Paenibacillus sp. J5C2022]